MPISKTPSTKKPPKKMPQTAKKPDFEKSIARLEEIVNLLEDGELSLEDSLKNFEEGVTLTRSCQTALLEAEQTVKMLTEKEGEHELTDFDMNDDNE